MSIDHVIEKLEENHYVNSDQVLQIKNQDLNNISKLPIASEILIGFGAFISTLFFCLFVGATSFMSVEPKYLYLFWSGTFITGALGINQLVKKKEYNTSYAYWRDVSLCFMIAGKALFVGSCQQFFYSEFESIINVLIIASIFVTVLLYPVYRNSVDRFMSVGAILILAWVKVLYFFDPALIKMHFYSNVFLLFHFVLLWYLVYSRKVRSNIEPIRYAVMFSILLYFTIPKWNVYYLYMNLAFFKYFIATLVVLPACVLILELSQFKCRFPSQPLTNILIMVVLLGMILPPEIIFALTLILYGYGCRENKILTIGLLFFPMFMFMYYYHMPVSLLYKSIYLMISGSMFILIGLYVQHYFSKVKQNG